MASRSEHAARPHRESVSKRLGLVARRIKARDNNRCVYCGATAETSGAPLHLDHLTPRASGGEDTAQNLVLACRSCNCARHDKPLSAWCLERGLDARRVRAQARRALPAV